MVKEPYFEREVEEGVWLVGGFHGGGIGVNAAILTSGKQGVIVDTLTRPVETRRLVKRVHQWGVEPVALVNTHWHTDHTAGNCLYDCPIWSRKGGTRFLKHYWPKWVGGPREKRAGGLRIKPPDHQFSRRASLDLDGNELQLIPLPGHTLDSIGVYLPDRRILIAGDAVMDLPFLWFGGDSRKAIQSLREVQRLRPRLILQGHGPPCSYARVATDIRYLERIRKAVKEAKNEGVPRRVFVKMPMEKFLTPSRSRELGDSWASLHEANLWKVWMEAGKGQK
jgi:cyclase